MTKQDIIRKLTSRKLWLAISEFVTMLMIYFGATEGSAEQIAALIMAGAGAIAYVIAEGLTDASAAKPAPGILLEGTIEDAE